MWTKLVVLGALALRAAAYVQTPFNAPHKPATAKHETATLGPAFQAFAASPVAASASTFMRQELDALSADAFSTLLHPAYPRHGVRMKKSAFCDGTVDAYTGYVDVEARHIFFYFFKSRGDWKNDDVVFVSVTLGPGRRVLTGAQWTNGGPGCSSAIGLFMELGPCRVTNATKDPVHNKYGWNEHANVIFVDQPIGVGFSYADHGETVVCFPASTKWL
jgi:hypothetical protein